MKIFSKYIINEFLAPLFLSLISFAVIILIVQIFNQIYLITDYKPSLWIITKYFLLQTPFLLLETAPIAGLMAVLFALSHLSKGSELIAMRANGISIFLIARPLILMGLLFTGFCIFLNETFVPQTLKLADHIKRYEIEKKVTPLPSIRHNLYFRDTHDDLYHIGTFNPFTNTLSNILILGFKRGITLNYRIDAQSAKYKNDQWIFYNGYFRTFKNNGSEIHAIPFYKKIVDLPEKPSNFFKKRVTSTELNFTQLLAYIHQLQMRGSDYHKELVELYLKISFPFSCTILILLGIPWGGN